MHDPMTVAFEIKRPWKDKPSKFFPKGYRPSMITIWHVDPETDGSDDSCGWSSPRLTKEEMEKIKSLLSFEMKYLFSKTEDGRYLPKVSPEQVVFTAFSYIAWQVFRKEIKPSFVPKLLSLIYNHMDNFTDTFRRPADFYDIERSFFFMARAFKKHERKWWQHPRWHIHHWKIQIHPLQKLTRWLFVRCAGCGKRFGWNESGFGCMSSDRTWHLECQGINKKAGGE